MKFIFSTDWHHRGTNPVSRKDFYPHTILKKTLEVITAGNADDAVMAQIQGGDMLHLPDVAPSVVRDCCLVIRESSKPFLGVIGNHDEFGYNPETIERAMIGVVEAAGLFKRLSMDNPVIFEQNGLRVGITGCDSHSKLDKDERIEDYFPKKPDNVDILIHVVHGFLTDHKWMDDIPHTLIDNVLDTEADIILTGHEHSGYGIIKKMNDKGQTKIFCNPGALGRISAALSEMDRMPKYAIIDIKDKKNIDVSLKVLECALLSEEILDREAIEEQIQKEQTINDFVSTLSFFTMDDFSIYDILDLVAKKEAFSSKIVDEARLTIQQVEEEMAGEIEREMEES